MGIEAMYMPTDCSDQVVKIKGIFDIYNNIYMPTFCRADFASARKKSPDSVRLHTNQGAYPKGNFRLNGTGLISLSLGRETGHGDISSNWTCPIDLPPGSHLPLFAMESAVLKLQESALPEEQETDPPGAFRRDGPYAPEWRRQLERIANP